MKKAKLMLSAIAVLAVVGGAFAFKASRQPVRFFSNTITTTVGGAPTTLCTVPYTIPYTTAIVLGAPTFATSVSLISKPTASCPLTTLYLTN